MRPEQRLWWAGVAFGGGSAVHIFDHLRRGQGSITDELNWLGTAGIVLQVVIVTLVLTRHPSAPPVAALGGTVLVAGFLAVHWLPHWSAFSDSYVDHPQGAFSAFASIAEILTGAVVTAAGTAMIRRDHGPSVVES